MQLKTALMVIVAFFFYAVIDILIWQRIFEVHNLIEIGVGVYHLGYFFVLLGFVVVGALALLPHVRHSLAYGISLLILAFSGWEDIMFYWLDGKAIQPLLPWLDKNPMIFFDPVTNVGVLISAFTWLAITSVFFYFMTRKTNSR